MVPEDAATVTDVALSSGLFSGLFSGEDIEILQKLMTSYFAGTNAEGHACVIDDEDDCALAVANNGPAATADRTWYLTVIAVREDRKGHGRGADLPRYVKADLRTRSQRLLLVETSGRPEFSRTRAFYAKYGYHEEAHVRDFYENHSLRVDIAGPLLVEAARDDDRRMIGVALYHGQRRVLERGEPRRREQLVLGGSAQTSMPIRSALPPRWHDTAVTRADGVDHDNGRLRRRPPWRWATATPSRLRSSRREPMCRRAPWCSTAKAPRSAPPP